MKVDYQTIVGTRMVRDCIKSLQSYTMLDIFVNIYHVDLEITWDKDRTVLRAKLRMTTNGDLGKHDQN